MSAKKVVDKCSVQESTFTEANLGEAFDANNLVVLCSENSDVYECYTYDELIHWFDSQEKLTYWNIKERYRRVYKLAYTGIWVDEIVYDMIVKEKYSTLFLYKKEVAGIGSSFGVSQTHGAEFPIYTSIPITRASLDDLKSINAFVKSSIATRELIRPSPSVIDQLRDEYGYLINNESQRCLIDMDIVDFYEDIFPDTRCSVINGLYAIKLAPDAVPDGVLSYSDISRVIPNIDPLKVDTIFAKGLEIKKIDDDIKGFKALIGLDLTNNQIDETFDFKPLEPLKNLTYLVLYNNNLPYINEAMGFDEMKKLQTITLGGNFLVSNPNRNMTKHFEWDSAEQMMTRTSE